MEYLLTALKGAGKIILIVCILKHAGKMLLAIKPLRDFLIEDSLMLEEDVNSWFAQVLIGMLFIFCAIVLCVICYAAGRCTSGL